MLVYVQNSNGQPLMPTSRCGKVRRLLKNNEAIVVKRCPFTVRLLYDAGTATQEITLGVDAGSKTVGISATTKTKVLYEAEVRLRNDITKLLAQRREQRRTRRNRKTRYRAPRFDNRKKPEGWLAPSVQHKVDTHLKVVDDVCRLLPVSKIIVETAAFDLQRLKADLAGLKRPEGKEYQEGDQFGFWNAREYVLWRDGHQCQCCMGKSKDPVLNVHHIESRLTGGDAPDNLITLCEYCHKQYHQGKIQLPERIRRGKSYRHETFMGIMRWAFYNKLKEMYPGMVAMAYGYITKNTRIRNGLPKEHYVDARCISGNPKAEPLGYVYYQKKVRCHNRQIHKLTVQKGGIRKSNQAPYEVKGFRLYDAVKAKGRQWYIKGRRLKGSFVLKDLTGNVLEIVPGKIKLLYRQSGFIGGQFKALLS